MVLNSPEFRLKISRLQLQLREKQDLSRSQRRGAKGTCSAGIKETLSPVSVQKGKAAPGFERQR